ncbi:Trm112 family protein [Blochmannia endosymbiont of Polyrhachis (Hedomyrma) turneri]|uniref:Trm112 family protein n=1 Tax=Blochmannia endosymbiont of Polyrhachis (Hedomyrma) turneri TaxID=1505596 RepID=UPI00061A7299|nr:UPF0434 protein [Blochmannia endosymbiont of Polyrhachis (Hedomyrma) turneri]
MDNKLLRILVCPICYRSLYFLKSQWKLICRFDQISFPILHGIPILLKDRSRNFFFNDKIKR